MIHNNGFVFCFVILYIFVVFSVYKVMARLYPGDMKWPVVPTTLSGRIHHMSIVLSNSLLFSMFDNSHILLQYMYEIYLYDTGDFIHSNSYLGGIWNHIHIGWCYTWRKIICVESNPDIAWRWIYKFFIEKSEKIRLVSLKLGQCS